MYNYLFQGLLLGLAYVAPIGMQNLYVINTALRGNRVKTYQVAFITIFFDITLALACFFGIGLLLKNFPALKGVILLIGSFLIIYIGYSIVNSSSERKKNIELQQSLFNIIIACFVVTWLNPQAIIDGSLLLGSYNVSIPSSMAKYFIIGFCSASCIWFLFVSTTVLKLKNRFSNKVIYYINIICGSILILFGLKLGYKFMQMII